MITNCLFCGLPELCQCQETKLWKRLGKLGVHIHWLSSKKHLVEHDYTANMSLENQVRAAEYEIETIKKKLA